MVGEIKGYIITALIDFYIFIFTKILKVNLKY